jgi:hypothetical protein
MRFKVKVTRKLDQNLTADDSFLMYTGGSEQVSVALMQERYRELWAELHTKQDATPEWFAIWLSKVPCSVCKSSLKAILDELGPPNYDDWFAYSVRLHNRVNAKLGKPEIDLEHAKQIWN